MKLSISLFTMKTRNPLHLVLATESSPAMTRYLI
uniref:Uncharacterized protein n=1 Tax=Arundo donax TaxID=35708 RepID=A0A0A9C585_ARUDO